MKKPEILQSSLVVPATVTPRESLSLSDHDLLGAHLHNCTIYLFKNTQGAKDFFSVEVLKSALAKALVLFYPLAGRYVVGPDGRGQIDCNAEGVPFVVAQLDCRSDDIQLEPISTEIRELFIPQEPQSLSLLQMLQVTYLKCGSVVLGTFSHHILVDGKSAAHFFQTWSMIARGDLKSIVQPSFDKTPLCARSPPKISYDFPAYTTDQSNIKGSPNACVLSLFKLSQEQIRHLKIRCSNGTSTYVSTFCAVSALLWKCYCIAQGLAPGTKSCLYFGANMRNRIHTPIPAYFGNASIRSSVISEVSKITSSPIGDVADTVKAVIDGLTEEYFRSLIDYMKVMSDKKMSVRPKDVSESDLMIRSIIGLSLCDVDFGWGAPQLFSWERPTRSRVAYIQNELGNGAGIKVVLSLDPSTMKRFEKVFYEELLFADE
ncbi:hypothetical protein LUZ63_001541 [Rhynchospora breviuscula]|uniref:Uncharacterized protein n=1 Tax=Rhynchospora breviuscula TaxID=2022672 RepID=A0A9Q0CX39_9POAL|nr:hypothetical protein LUZ63_001541 [Rhynchospora breviuscula]